MLFDLQSPGRRRVVRIVFGGLAAVFAISFVFLGVGTGGGGFSLSDLFGGGGGSSGASAFDDQIKAADARLAANPNDTVALGQLVQYHYSAGSQDVDSNQQLTSDGEQHLREAADAWNRYVKLSNGKIPPGTATYALTTFDQLGSVDFQKARTDTSTSEALADINAARDDWKSAAQAQQILIAAQPNKSAGTSYARLASYYYLAGDTQQADQAAAQAKSGKGSQGSTVDSQLKPIQQLGQQLTTAIASLTKQQQQTQQAQGGGGNPLGGISPSGGLGGAGTGGLGGP